MKGHIPIRYVLIDYIVSQKYIILRKSMVDNILYSRIINMVSMYGTIGKGNYILIVTWTACIQAAKTHISRIRLLMQYDKHITF